MKRVIAFLAVAAIFVGVILVVRSLKADHDQPSKPDIAACRTAMKRQLQQALSSGATGSRPPECKGVSDEELQRIAVEILEGGQ